MKQINRFKLKKVLVLGLAKSGFAAAKLLHSFGANVVVNDNKPLDQNEEAKKLTELEDITIICGSHPVDLLDASFDYVVKNPGIPYQNPMLTRAKELSIPIITEIELAYLISEADILAITGTNGKTTTTTLVHEMIKREKEQTLLAGNIGMVSCEVAINSVPNQWMVMELSSFQLMGIETFRPKISVFLNLFDAHLDYHGTRKEYGLAKANIFKNQLETDFAVLNADDEDVVYLSNSILPQKVWFSTKKILTDGAYIKNAYIYWNDEPIVAVHEVSLPGAHNLENILAATAAAALAGVSLQTIASTLKEFIPVKHRLQFVKRIEERNFYNDSKATNILATEKAVQAFKDPIILLAGGLDRGNNFDALVPSLEGVKAIVLFGQTAPKLEEAAHQAGIKIIKHVKDVEKAVPAAFQLSSPGDVILLSPACASWDQYKTFEERGDIFIEAVHKL